MMLEANNWRILIVDDEDDSIDILEQTLEIYGVTTIKMVANGVECLATLDNYDANLLIIDLSMPEMDGWRTLENVRANPDFNAIRMVAITAYHSAQVALEARRVGFDAYFEKPIDVDTFMDTLGRIMG